MNEPDRSQEGIAEEANSTLGALSPRSSRRFNRHSTARNKCASLANANHVTSPINVRQSWSSCSSLRIHVYRGSEAVKVNR